MKLADIDGQPFESEAAEGAKPPAKTRASETFEDAARAAKPMRWVVSGLLGEHCQLILAGAAKISNKSWLAAHLAGCVAAGASFLGHPCAAGARSVVYSAIEGGVERWRRRAAQLGFSRPTWQPGMATVNYGIEGYERTLSDLRRGARPGLWIIDTMARVTAHRRLDENSQADMTNLLAEHEALAHASGATIFWLHHFRKLGDVKRGASAIDATVDGWIDAAPVPDSQETIRLKWTLRDAKPTLFGVAMSQPNGVMQFTRTDDVPTGDMQQAAPPIRGVAHQSRQAKEVRLQKVLDILPVGECDANAVTGLLRAVARKAGGPQPDLRWVRSALDALVSQGRIRRVGPDVYFCDGPAAALGASEETA